MGAFSESFPEILTNCAVVDKPLLQKPTARGASRYFSALGRRAQTYRMVPALGYSGFSGVRLFKAYQGFLSSMNSMLSNAYGQRC